MIAEAEAMDAPLAFDKLEGQCEISRFEHSTFVEMHTDQRSFNHLVSNWRRRTYRARITRPENDFNCWPADECNGVRRLDDASEDGTTAEEADVDALDRDDQEDDQEDDQWEDDEEDETTGRRLGARRRSTSSGGSSNNNNPTPPPTPPPEPFTTKQCYDIYDYWFTTEDPDYKDEIKMGEKVDYMQRNNFECHASDTACQQRPEFLAPCDYGFGCSEEHRCSVKQSPYKFCDPPDFNPATFEPIEFPNGYPKCTGDKNEDFECNEGVTAADASNNQKFCAFGECIIGGICQPVPSGGVKLEAGHQGYVMWDDSAKGGTPSDAHLGPAAPVHPLCKDGDDPATCYATVPPSVPVGFRTDCWVAIQEVTDRFSQVYQCPEGPGSKCIIFHDPAPLGTANVEGTKFMVQIMSGLFYYYLGWVVFCCFCTLACAGGAAKA